MSSQLALLLTFGFAGFLLWRERQENPESDGALWIPLVWVLITGSRFVTQWLSMLGIQLGDSSMEEGSPLDALVFLALIVSGFAVLKRRGVRLSTIVSNNRWLTLFFVYCLVSILWSDFPFVAFKRWIKTLGHPIMALVILTDPAPDKAFRSLMKRAGFVLIPLSILLIKYYPEYGRGFDDWTGEATNNGASLNKNELGYVCMLFGLFFVWNFLKAWRIEDRKSRRAEVLLSAAFLCMVW